MTTARRRMSSTVKIKAEPNTKIETYELGEKVKTLAVNSPGIGQGIDGFGTVVGIQYLNLQVGGKLVYQVREKSTNYCYMYAPEALKKCKSQKLFAYLDSTEEVHWATKAYSDTELTSFGFKRAKEFDKTIDLE